MPYFIFGYHSAISRVGILEIAQYYSCNLIGSNKKTNGVCTVGKARSVFWPGRDTGGGLPATRVGGSTPSRCRLLA
jgi:hypothetical protein